MRTADVFIDLLTNEENQPHQFVGNPDALQDAIAQHIRAMRFEREEASGKSADFNRGLQLEGAIEVLWSMEIDLTTKDDSHGQ